MTPYQQAFIELALTHRALRFGEFQLKSGRMSPYFFNVGQLNSGQALTTLGKCYADAILSHNLPFDVLFGPAYKGIPLVCTTAISLARDYQKNIPFCFNRKEAKNHGEMGNIIGAPLSGRILIIDDVITAGTAIRESFNIIEHHQGIVNGIIVALDRQEKGESTLSAIQEIQTQFNIPVYPIINFENIMEYITHHPDYRTFLKPLDKYRQQYGI